MITSQKSAFDAVKIGKSWYIVHENWFTIWFSVHLISGSGLVLTFTFSENDSIGSGPGDPHGAAATQEHRSLPFAARNKHTLTWRSGIPTAAHNITE